MSAAIAQFWSNVNLFKADFGHIHQYVQCKHFKQYCCSFYVASLWLLFSQGLSDACIAWRKALGNIWKLSPMTHCDVVALVAESKPLEVSLGQRFANLGLVLINMALMSSRLLLMLHRVILFLSTLIIMWT